MLMENTTGKRLHNFDIKLPISYQSYVKAVSQTAQKEREYNVLIISKICLPSNTNIPC